MHCKSYSHFFSKKFQHICISLDVNFNESLTNDIVSFEQLGPGLLCVGCFQEPPFIAIICLQKYRIWPSYRIVHLGFSKLLGTLSCGKICIYLLRIHYKKDQKRTYLMMRMWFFSEFLFKGICCGYSSRCNSNEYQQRMPKDMLWVLIMPPPIRRIADGH